MPANSNKENKNDYLISYVPLNIKKCKNLKNAKLFKYFQIQNFYI